MTKLYITRHGQTQWNAEGRLQGQKDSKLTELGEKQAEWLRDRLNEVDIDIIISSSSGRALRTAQIIRGNRNIEIIPNDNLKEINLGEWEGMQKNEVKKNWPEEDNHFWNSPHLYNPIGGEGFIQLLDRVSNEIEEIISQYEGKNIFVVTHAIVLKGLITYFEKKELKDLWNGAYMHSTCLNIIEIKENSRRFILQGDTSHYQEEM